jgi:hypothetical protein
LPPSQWDVFLARLQKIDFAGKYEKWSPSFWAAAIFVLALFLTISGKTTGDFVEKALPNFVSVAAFLVAFQMTAQSLMLVLIDSPLVNRLKGSGHYQLMVGYFKSAVGTLMRFIAVALSVISLRSLALSPSWADRLIPSLIAFFFVHAFLASLRLNRIMIKIMLNKNVGPSSGSVDSRQNQMNPQT